MSLLILQLFDSNKVKIAEQLAKKVEQAPAFFKQAPIVIDLQTIQNDEIDLPYLVDLLRTHGLVPVAIRGGNPQQQATAIQLTLGLLTANATRIERPHQKISSNREAQNTEKSTVPTKIITQPVRSGQQVVAQEGDLVILAAVNAGAEVLAHRHIHIYSALRGRALAGINGDVQARIFCQHFEAELVAIAGHYQINEQIPNAVYSRATQVYLAENTLKIEAFDIRS